MSKHSQPESKELKIVLIGKTGSGKTSVMSAILERTEDNPDLSAASKTTKCKTERREFDGQKLAVVDTPGLRNTKLESNEVKKEILSSILSASPGPFVFLYVVRPPTITNEDEKAMTTFLEIIGKESNNYCLGLVNNADQFDKTKIDPFKKEVNKISGNYFDERFFDFDDSNKNPNQVHDLLKKINSMAAESKEYPRDAKMQKKLEKVMQEINTKEDTLEKAVEVILNETVGEPLGKLLLHVIDRVSEFTCKWAVK